MGPERKVKGLAQEVDMADLDDMYDNATVRKRRQKSDNSIK